MAQLMRTSFPSTISFLSWQPVKIAGNTSANTKPPMVIFLMFRFFLRQDT